MKNLISKLILVSLTGLLLGCKASSGGNSANSGEIAPLTLDELIITLVNSASFEFAADSVQGDPNVETGAIIYNKNSAANTNLVDIAGNPSTFAWPEEFINARYTFERIGNQSARIVFWGQSSEDVPDEPISILGEMSEDAPGTFAILFDNGGTGFITSLEMTFRTQRVGVIYTGSFAATIADINGNPVAPGYDTDPTTRPSRLTDGMFANDFLSYTDEVTSDGYNFLFADIPISVSPGSRVTERGTTTIENDTQGTQTQGDYQLEQPLGTDDVIMTITYTASTDPNRPVGLTEVYTLTFGAPEGGRFVTSRGRSGTFSFFATGDL